MGMEIYTGQQEMHMLRQSVASTNPIEFVLIEDMLLRLTKERAPDWRPGLILSPGGWRRYQQGQERIRDVEDMIHQAWLDMTKAVLDARTRLLTWQADTKLRELQWAEEIRKQNHTATMQMHAQEKMMRLQDNIAQLQEARTHTNSKEILALTHAMEKELLSLKLGQDDPFARMQRYMQAVESAQPILQKFAQEDDTHQADAWIVETILDGMRTLNR